MKKLSALILLAAITVSMFSACSGGETPELLSFLSEDDNSINLWGDTVVFLQEHDLDESLYEQAFNTRMYDELLERFDEIEKKYNCVAVIKNAGPDDDYITKVQNAIVTGDKIGDVMYCHGVNKMSLFASAGYLYPLTELKDYIDYENSEKFGTAGLLESAMWKGIPYAVQPVQWIGFNNSFCYVIAYNPQLFTAYGLTDLHEFYETETWTWENYENLFNQFDNGGKENLYLMAANQGRHGFMALYSNGIKFCSYDDNGVARCDIDTQPSLEAIDWNRKMYTDYADKIQTCEIWDTTAFSEENALMTFATSSSVTIGELQFNSNVRFSIMPFPCGPDGTYGQWANWIEGMRGFAIPANNERPEIAASMINDLCEPFIEITGSGDLTEYYNDNVFFDPLDSEILLEVGKFTRAYYYQNLQGMRDFMNALDQENRPSAAELVGMHYAKVEQFVEAEMMPNYVNYIHDHLYAEDN